MDFEIFTNRHLKYYFDNIFDNRAKIGLTVPLRLKVENLFKKGFGCPGFKL